MNNRELNKLTNKFLSNMYDRLFELTCEFDNVDRDQWNEMVDILDNAMGRLKFFPTCEKNTELFNKWNGIESLDYDDLNQETYNLVNDITSDALHQIEMFNYETLNHEND